MARVAEEAEEAPVDLTLGVRLTHTLGGGANVAKQTKPKPKRHKAHKAHTLFTTRRANRFLKALAEGGSVSSAAASVGISRITAYNLRSRNPEFARLWDEAIEVATDRLEDVARHVATTGWLEPVYQGGELVGYRRRFSIPVLLTLLRAHRPEKFRRTDSADLDVPPPAPSESSDVVIDFHDDGESDVDS